MATRSSKSRPPAGTVRIDFSKVKDGGRVRVPEGDYVVKVKAVKQETSQSGNPMLVWTFTGTDGKLKGRDLTDRTSLQTNALWKVRDVLEAMGVKVPKKIVDLPLKPLIGKELGVTLFDDEYEGRISSKVGDYISPDSIGDDGNIDEEEEEDEVEEEEGTDLDEMDRAELKQYIKDNGLEVKVKKSMDDDDIRAAIREAEGNEDEDEDAEDTDLEELDLEGL